MLGTTFTVVVRAAVAPPPVGSGQGDEMVHSLDRSKDGQ